MAAERGSGPASGSGDAEFVDFTARPTPGGTYGPARDEDNGRGRSPRRNVRGRTQEPTGTGTYGFGGSVFGSPGGGNPFNSPSGSPQAGAYMTPPPNHPALSLYFFGGVTS